MTYAVFRADGSPRLGMGHVMRCVAFAQGLTGLGVESAFMMRSLDPQVARVVDGYGYPVEEVPAGATLEDDCACTRDFAAQRGAGLIVADICHSQTHKDLTGLQRFHQSLTSDFYLVAMAGDQVFDLPAHLVVAPYMGTGFDDLGCRRGRTVLAGADYVIMRPEFVAAASRNRVVREEAKRILITVGGSDEYHSTIKILEAILALGRRHLELKVVLGAGFGPELRSQVASLLGTMDCSHQVVGQDVDMADAMIWADLAVTGDGITKYETAATGTPSIMISRPQSNDGFNRSFQEAGSTMFLGDCTELSLEYLTARLRELLDDFGRRKTMSCLGKSLVDGKAFDRILAHIPREVLGD